MSIFPYPPTSLDGLAARWVQWAAASGPFRHPVRDTDGRYAHRRQPNDVWFLAGTFGGMVERRCTMPAGRPIFFPAFNIWAREGTRIPAIPGAKGEAYLDHKPVPVTAVGADEPFEVRGAFRNPVTGGRSPVRMRVWGLWTRLDPLTPGPHRVECAGMTGGGFHVRATYHLQVG